MVTDHKRNIVIYILAIFVLSFLIRIGNIGYSFWNDEAHVALMTRYIVEKRMYLPTGLYQFFTYYFTLISMKLFGYNEFGARVLYVIVGSVLPVFVYFVAKKYTDNAVAIASSIAIVVSYTEIAWSRQVRPYIVLQLLLLAIILIDNLVYKLTIFGVALLFHTSAIFISPYILYRFFKEKKYSLWIYCVVSALLVLVLWKLNIASLVSLFIKSVDISRVYRKIMHFKIFWKSNIWLFGTAVIGFILSMKDTSMRDLDVLVALTTLASYFAVLIRPDEATYVRYTMLVFPLFFVYSSYFIYKLLGLFNNKHVVVVVLIPIVMLSIMKFDDNLGVNPRAYYSINHDVRENPLADYGAFFNKLRTQFDDYKKAVVVDSWFDRTLWYIDKLDFFMISRPDHDGVCDDDTGVCFITNTDELSDLYSKSDKVLVVIEEWPSVANQDMKNWVIDNSKFEYRVCDNNLADESWCLSLYSKGY